MKLLTHAASKVLVLAIGYAFIALLLTACFGNVLGLLFTAIVFYNQDYI